MSKTFPGLGCDRRAYFSQDRTCRYSLTADFADRGHSDLWIMMNPSKADESVDDPTVRRCFLRSMRDGARKATICNTVPYMATDPMDCKRWLDSVASGNIYLEINRSCLAEYARRADRIIIAWGNPFHKLDGKSILRLLAQDGIRSKVHYLRKTKIGAPSHPLYLPDSLELKRWFE